MPAVLEKLRECGRRACGDRRSLAGCCYRVPHVLEVGAIPGEGGREHLPHEHCQRVDIDLLGALLVAVRLGSHVSRGAGEVGSRLDVRPLLLARQAEVSQFDQTTPVDEKVLGLDVAVHHAAEVEVAENIGDHGGVLEELRFRDRAGRSGVDHVMERASRDDFGDEEVVQLAEPEHAQHARMEEGAEEVGLALELLHLISVGSHRVLEALDGARELPGC
mmetsp:Transcript_38837/g.91866  ORF Transcript_38837/g.91866 Transcript_38837/m.91866 type:complete len:219 (-) Transcript_38837:422-1078(-)